MEALAAGARALGLELSLRQLEQYEQYLAELTAWNSRVNLTSPAALADAERVHFLDSLTLAPWVRQWVEQGTGGAGSLVDVGSGAGFPGLALKVALPELSVTLVEATGKKTEFLNAVVRKLQLADARVVQHRAEDAGRDPELRERFDVAVARALGSLPVVLELALPLCRAGGLLIAPRGVDARAEAEACEAALEALGGRLRGVEPVHVPGLAVQRALVIVEKVGPTPERFPRRSGVPAKRPLT